jgi:septal ring factor EnvC (AmiA/AmiB activator)
MEDGRMPIGLSVPVQAGAADAVLHLIEVLSNPDRSGKYISEMRTALADAGTTAARLEADRHRAELDAREAALDRRASDLQQLAAELDQREAAGEQIAQRLRALDEREAALDQHAAVLQERAAKLQVEEAAVARVRADLDRRLALLKQIASPV